GVLVSEIARIEQHGFTAGELERAKQDMLRQYKQSVVEHDKSDARRFVEEIVRNFLEGETMPGIEAELALVERFLPTITVAELNRLALAWGGTANRVIMVSGPDKMAKPAPQALLDLVRTGEAQKTDAYEDVVAKGSLLAKAPQAGKILRSREVSEIG